MAARAPALPSMLQQVGIIGFASPRWPVQPFDGRLVTGPHPQKRPSRTGSQGTSLRQYAEPHWSTLEPREPCALSFPSFKSCEWDVLGGRTQVPLPLLSVTAPPLLRAPRASCGCQYRPLHVQCPRTLAAGRTISDAGFYGSFWGPRTLSLRRWSCSSLVWPLRFEVCQDLAD